MAGATMDRTEAEALLEPLREQWDAASRTGSAQLAATLAR